jgi:hypothetical protein
MKIYEVIMFHPYAENDSDSYWLDKSKAEERAAQLNRDDDDIREDRKWLAIMHDTKDEPISGSMWTIERGNDVGPNDEGFREWCNVTDGNRTFEAKDKEDADWLCDLLNTSETEKE